MKFDYRACDREGRAQRGVLEADSLRHARDRLREKGWQVLAVQARGRPVFASMLAGRWMSGVSSGDVALLTRQLATLLSAALPLEEALMAVARQTEKKGLQAALAQVRQRILEGFPLAQALGQHPRIFDRLYCAMVAAGEISGHLAPVLERLADYVEQRQQMKNKIVQALVYPMVLTAVAIGVVAILLTAVVPKVIEQFVHMKQTLPLSTRMLLGASDGLRQWGALALMLALASLGAFRYRLRDPARRVRWHAFILRLPLVGKLSLAVNTARYAKTLSILNASAVPLLEAMRISAGVLGNDAARERLLAAMERVREGEGLSPSLEGTALFSPMMRHMIMSGERSGELDMMLERAATMQQEAFGRQVTLALGLFEPLLVIAMAGSVLFIILAILQPILQLNNMVG
ncbi:TPA: type II secretion system inner membrane protein GspF [Serratia marcescens]|uniref:type II secretion system inner membrane protein GspF n=1 Tax=Serratia marcescens TaxID=615 RepID=UPI0018D73EF4|nr:type II secretion system inner membrane protein GspF [Serratia marcescens]ELN4522172.1 type II secretion system inner membrane protein GspF [Serratia marcescens]ELN4523583.1 type II secretion system inner membrane protein GspF [Serratia marcescens]MBH2840447.1 type II secretion system inner membrane protein GspF [Serratia marcescens]MDR4882802.1 type II secretion system inner membrane protein GspF [Serratia marcescens]HEJ7008397.1 type II secretion system inner membrane protein GspF [Serrat